MTEVLYRLQSRWLRDRMDAIPDERLLRTRRASLRLWTILLLPTIAACVVTVILVMGDTRRVREGTDMAGGASMTLTAGDMRTVWGLPGSGTVNGCVVQDLAGGHVDFQRNSARVTTKVDGTKYHRIGWFRATTDGTFTISCEPQGHYRVAQRVPNGPMITTYAVTLALATVGNSALYVAAVCQINLRGRGRRPSAPHRQMQP